MDIPIMVLNDGETFTDVNGCFCTVAEGNEIDEIEQSLMDDTDNPLFYISYGLGQVYIEIVDSSRVNII